MSRLLNIRHTETEPDVRDDDDDDPGRELCLEVIEYLWDIRGRLHRARRGAPFSTNAMLAAETDVVAALVARLRAQIASNGPEQGA
jgi:hypothetical protein